METCHGRTADCGQASLADETSDVENSVQRTQPWDGRLNRAELERPGGMLMAALVQCAAQRHMKSAELAEQLGIPENNLNYLRHGFIRVSHANDDFLIKSAQFLGVPILMVKLMSGNVQISDYSRCSPVVIELNNAFEYVTKSEEFRYLLTNELRCNSFLSKYAIVKMYEKATDKLLFTSEVDLEALKEDMKTDDTLSDFNINLDKYDDDFNDVPF